MKKYLIGLDLDGTLLNNNSLISETTKEYIKKLVNEGHKVVIITGRPYRGTKHFYDQLDLNTPLVVDNGAYIVSENCKEFDTFRITVSKKHMEDMIEFANDNIITSFFSVGDDLYTFNYLEEVEFFYHLNDKTNIYNNHFDFDKMPEPANFSINVKGSFADEFESYIKSKTNNELDYRTWIKDEEIAVYEVFPKGINKGTAFKKLKEFYNIKDEHTISFGDGSNDIELLDQAHHGIKMINGQSKLDIYKTDTTNHTNDDDGVIKYLQNFFK